MRHNKLKEVSENIIRHIFKDGSRPYKSKKVVWILRRYFYYVMMAAIHGRRIGPRRKGNFVLGYIYREYVPWQMRRKSLFSSKAFGYEFRIAFEGPFMQKSGFKFTPVKKWRDQVAEVIETDTVYKLIQD